MINYTGTYTDHYQLIMAQVYFLKGQKDQTAVFDYYFRKLPFKGGYAIFAGLEDFIEFIEHLRFDEKDIAYLKEQGFHPDFLDYLRGFRFRGNIRACPEGEIIFPTCPILSVEANIIEAQLIETALLNILNFQTLIATKASRVRRVAGDRKLIDFGLRRAQGPAGYYASRAAMIGGFDATSNVRAARDYQIPVVGTMAHSFIQSCENELSAFRHFAEEIPENCVLLVDTYNTLESGVPHAIQVAKEMESRGQKLKGIRLDSGDLAFLAKAARQMLDSAGLHYVNITVSNQLDEHVIKSLLEQMAPIDAFGVGTRLVIGEPDSALDGVYKLAFSDNKPRIKLSDSLGKITLPFKKQVYRMVDSQHAFLGADVITLVDEVDTDVMHHPLEPMKSFSLKNLKKEPLLQPIIADGKRLNEPKSLTDIASYSRSRLALLPDEYKRFNNPHLYKVGISALLKTERDAIIQEHTVNL